MVRVDSVGAQLWLLAYDIRRGAPKGRAAGYAVAAGLLAELLLQGRLRDVRQRCEVADPAPIGCAAADDLLARIAGGTRRPWGDWIRDYRRAALPGVAAELADRCRIVPYERRVAKILAVRRHALVDPAGVDRLRAAVQDVAAGRANAAVEPRLAVLAALAATAGIGQLTANGSLEALAAAVAPVWHSLDASVRSLGVDLTRVRMHAQI